MTLGLVLDSSGFPKRSHVYEGNVSELATLLNVLLNRHYYGEIEDKRSRVRNTLLQIAEQKPISAQELLSSYCSLLYERHGSYEEVS